MNTADFEARCAELKIVIDKGKAALARVVEVDARIAALAERARALWAERDELTAAWFAATGAESELYNLTRNGGAMEQHRRAIANFRDRHARGLT